MQDTIIPFLRQRIFLVFLLALGVVVYSQFLFFGHISWDDPEMVFRNKAVQRFEVSRFFSSHYVGNYIPVTMLFHALAWLIFGGADWGHHLVNISIHLFNAVLVYRIGGRIFGRKEIALAGLVVFLLHPLQVESVGWISELKNVVSSAFYLLSTWWYLRFRQEKKLPFYFFCLVFFVAGCLSKSSVIVLPFVLLGIDLVQGKRWKTKDLLNKLPFILVSVVIGVINLRTQAADLFINHSHEFPYYQRLGFAGFAYIKYAQLFFIPYALSVIYPFPPQNIGVWALGFMCLAGLLMAHVLLYRNKKNGALFALWFFIVNLALVLQLVPFGEVLYADRYQYLPIIGLGWLIGMMLARLNVTHVAVVAGLAVLLGFLTFSRGKAWSSAITLYEDIIRKYPEEFIALNSAGVESMFMNRDDKALQYLDRAVKVAPHNYKGFYNRGLLFLKNNKPKEAIASFNQSLQIYDYVKAYAGRASAYYMMGDLSKAMNDAGKALQLSPNSATAHFVLGNCYNDLDRLEEALASYNRCIALNDSDADYFFKRAIVYGKQQDFRSSIGDLGLCLMLNPKYYAAYYWRAVAKMNLKWDPLESTCRHASLSIL